MNIVGHGIGSLLVDGVETSWPAGGVITEAAPLGLQNCYLRGSDRGIDAEYGPATIVDDTFESNQTGLPRRSAPDIGAVESE